MIVSLGRWILQHFRQAAKRRAGVAALARLDDRLLRDIGLSRHDVDALALGQVTFAELARRSGREARPSRLERVAPAGAAALERAAPSDTRRRVSDRAA